MAAIAACCAFTAGSAFAQDNDEFTRLMMQGVRQFKEGQNNPAQYEAAIESFKAARQINPIPDATYNIARAYHKLGKCDEALASYREYAATSAENAASVKDFIASLSKECGNTKGTLILRCSPENTRVSIDGQPSGSCLPEQIVAVGTHDLVFTADGYKTETRSVTVVADSRKATPIVVELNPTNPYQSGRNNARQSDDDFAQQNTNYGAQNTNYGAQQNTNYGAQQNTNYGTQQNTNYGAQQNTDYGAQQNYGSDYADNSQNNTDNSRNQRNSASDYAASSDFETVDNTSDNTQPVKNPDTGEYTKLFWSGVGLASGGALFSLIGGIVLGNSYKKDEYYISKKETMTTYSKNESAVGAGAAFLTIGTVAIASGVTCFILDKVFLKKDAEKQAENPTAITFEPVIGFSGDSASAGIAVTF